MANQTYESAIISISRILQIEQDKVAQAMSNLPEEDTQYLASRLEQKYGLNMPAEKKNVSFGLAESINSVCASLNNKSELETAVNQLKEKIVGDRENLNLFLDVLQEGYFHGLLKRVPSSELLKKD